MLAQIRSPHFISYTSATVWQMVRKRGKGPLGGNPPWMTLLMMIIFMLSVLFSTWRNFADGNGTKRSYFREI